MLEVGGAVDEGVLAAELFLDVAEADGYVFELDGVEGAGRRWLRRWRWRISSPLSLLGLMLVLMV